MNKKSENVALWHGPNGIKIDKAINDVPSIVNYAGALKLRETEKIAKVFQDGYFDMGTEFVWRKSMNRLKHTMASLGMQFLGEMLDRKDIDEYSSPENVLTDYDAIRLAESLGIVSSTGAFRLRQGFELMSHFFSDRAIDEEEELSLPEAVNVVRSCVQYVLGEQEISVAVNFSEFRRRLAAESLRVNDPQAQQLLVSAPFFSSTVLRMLLAGIKIEAGARLENILTNMEILLPLLWEKLPEEDRWAVGSAYSGMVADGNSTVTPSLKKVLLSVHGFDYVPETMRSEAYKKAAQAVIGAHFDYNNFYHEETPTRQLSAMGSRIPKAALGPCLQAYLIVYLGNRFGHSFSAAPIAEKELRQISNDRWEYYFNRIFRNDDKVAYELTQNRPAEKFISLSRTLGFENLAIDYVHAKKLVAAAHTNNVNAINKIALEVYKENHSGD